MFLQVQPKFKPALILIIALLSYFQTASQGNSIVSNKFNSGPGSLRNAIVEANADLLSTSENPHKITFALRMMDTIIIESPFLVVTNHVNIVGPGKDKLVISGNNTNRIFWLQNGTITISDLTLAEGSANGGNGFGTGGGGLGAGGAIFMHEGRDDPDSSSNVLSGLLTVSLKRVELKNNKAVGGSGGSYYFDFPNGYYYPYGAGGGMGGNGGYLGGGGVIGNGSDAGGSVTNAVGNNPGTNGNIKIFGSGGFENASGALILPGFGGGAGYNFRYGYPISGNFGGGGSGVRGMRNFDGAVDGGSGGFGGGGGGAFNGGFGGFGGGGGAAASGGFGGESGYINFRQEGDLFISEGRGGNGMGAGGAVFVCSGKLILSDVTFTGNTAAGYNNAMGLGGAIFILNSGIDRAPGTTTNPTAVGCGEIKFTNNTASNAGNLPGSNDNNQYGSISYDTVQIVSQPKSQTVIEGSSVTALVTTKGTVLSYQWYKNGVSLDSSQQTATLKLANVTTVDAGQYTLVVTGICHSITSEPLILKVNSQLVVSISNATTFNNYSNKCAINTVYKGYYPIASYAILSGVILRGKAPFKYLWSNGSTKSYIFVSPSVTTTYTLKITDASGTIANATRKITVLDVRCGTDLNKISVCRKNAEALCISKKDVANYLFRGYCLGNCTEETGETRARDITSNKLVTTGEPEELRLMAKPNPSRTYFTVFVSSRNVKDRVTLKIADITGRVIEIKSVKAAENVQIGILYPPGFYIINAVQGDQIAVLQLMKQ